MSKFKTFFILFAIIFIGGFLRFYKLDWGKGLFTHPDEYHIVASVSQLSFPNQMHPHFFSYGTVTMYLIYFTQELLKSFSLIPNSFILGRFYSALFSTLTILLVYKTASIFLKKPWALTAALLISLNPGLIQQAHFATPESSLTFFLFGSLLFLLYFLQGGKVPRLLLSSVFLGLALGVKISSLVFLLPLITGVTLHSFKKPLRLVSLGSVSLILVIITFAIVAPYTFLDFPAFRSNLEYEGGLAIGRIPVFYTRQFIDTVPVLFQLEKILSYALGPVLLLTGIIGFFTCLFSFLKKQKSELLLFLVAFLSLFIPNAFLFAKWTRFIAPTFPFFAIFTVFFLSKIEKMSKGFASWIAGAVIITTFIWAYAFFSIYQNPDVRLSASNWLEENIPSTSVILIEGGNMIDVPLRGDFQRISLDFYNLEDNLENQQKIVTALLQSDYFIIQSRRVFMNHQRLPHLFPKTASFYNAFFSGNLGFEQIKELHSYPALSFGKFSLEFPDETAEETWSVFDHPVIRVFQNKRRLSKEDYAKIFEE
ncbi:MAG: glycosyltransferase family 39 protein [Candidatus Levybacteria bacterium]|nr:glycosyltransferase family 39 protein [Candidatus Levybacteria bacterium]